jgi:hypothetical protein
MTTMHRMIMKRGFNWLAALVATLVAGSLAAMAATNAATPSALFTCDFTAVPAGSPPDSFMVIQGDFAVKESGTNKWLELPGAPLDSHLVLFGPVTNANVTVEARVQATKKGRRMPTFGVGLGGVAGYKLQVAQAKDAIELLLDAQAVTNAPFAWKSGVWTQCQLQVLQTGANAWTIEARAWNAGDPEPKDWPLKLVTQDKPISGQASVLGSPFSGEPILYDDLRVSPAGAGK